LPRRSRIVGFRDRSRAAHRRIYEIQRMTTRQRQGAGSRQTTSYRALIEIAEAVVASAGVALDDTAAVRGKDPLTALNIKALREEIAHYSALGARVIDQARRRVLEGEQVPTLAFSPSLIISALCASTMGCLHLKRFIRSSSRTPT
jgi:IS5 family transposase